MGWGFIAHAAAAYQLKHFVHHRPSRTVCTDPSHHTQVQEVLGESINHPNQGGVPPWAVAIGGLVGAVMAAELMTYGLETTAQWLAGNRKRGAENGYLEVRSPAPSGSGWTEVPPVGFQCSCTQGSWEVASKVK